jgi:hypothetical protein
MVLFWESFDLPHLHAGGHFFKIVCYMFWIKEENRVLDYKEWEARCSLSKPTAWT